MTQNLKLDMEGLEMEALGKDIECLINKYSREEDSNTPDFILAAYLIACLEAFEVASNRRQVWYGVDLAPGEMVTGQSKDS